MDLYTSGLENFGQYDDNYRFYPRKRGLPHERKPCNLEHPISNTENATAPARLSMLNELIQSGFTRYVGVVDRGMTGRRPKSPLQGRQVWEDWIGAQNAIAR